MRLSFDTILHTIMIDSKTRKKYFVIDINKYLIYLVAICNNTYLLLSMYLKRMCTVTIFKKIICEKKIPWEISASCFPYWNDYHVSIGTPNWA